jgi:cobalt/nickel transport system permease protein
MIRYLNVVNDELIRMRIARESRGFQAKGLRSWKVLSQTLGALFIRSYERGERVYLAMLSRGFQGKMPDDNDVRETQLRLAFVLPGIALGTSIVTGLLI